MVGLLKEEVNVSLELLEDCMRCIIHNVFWLQINELCKTKELNPNQKQKYLMKWLEDTHDPKISQVLISKIFKRLTNLFQEEVLLNPNAKKGKIW